MSRITTRFWAAVAAAVMVLTLSASAALAGEVKGPPTGTEPNTNRNWPAILHANSACVFSGLNDHQPGQGPVDNVTQTPADGPPGAPGHGAGEEFPIGCRGGSNPYNQP